MVQRVVSGIRPTGRLHIGNYFGAVQSFIALQDKYPCYFFIADFHSLTTHPTPGDLQGSVRTVLAEYLAAGKALGDAYKSLMRTIDGRVHYPVMTAVQVVALIEDLAKVEIEATAVIPDA